MNFSCFVLSRTTPTSALLKPDERFGFDLQCQFHLRAGASLQFRHDRVQDGVKRLCEAASAALADRSVLSGPRRGRPPGSGRTWRERARPSADSDQAAQGLWLGRDRHKPAREGVRHHPDSVVMGRLRAGAGTAEVPGSNPLRSTNCCWF